VPKENITLMIYKIFVHIYAVQNADKAAMPATLKIWSNNKPSEAYGINIKQLYRCQQKGRKSIISQPIFDRLNQLSIIKCHNW